MEQLLHLQKLQQLKQRDDLLDKVAEILEAYKSDIRLFGVYCTETNQAEDIDALLNYLAFSIHEQKIKKTTWERRVIAIRRYLKADEQEFTSEQQNTLAKLRAVFRLEEYAPQTLIEGQTTVDRSDVMQKIVEMEDPGDRAVCLVNLITASRPSEMVWLRIRDFDLKNREVAIYLVKQHKWHKKRITPDVVDAVREYIRAYDLKPDDFSLAEHAAAITMKASRSLKSAITS